MDNKVNIKDGGKLDQLIEAQKKVLAIKDLANSAQQSFKGMIDKMVEQMECLKKKMDEAEMEMKKAEESYRSCSASQKYDEEKRCLSPSCFMEEQSYNNAKSKYDKFRQKYDEAEKILKECCKEAEDYHNCSVNVCEELYAHTDNAIIKMDEIKGKLMEYNSFSVAIEKKSRREVFEEATAKIKKKAGISSSTDTDPDPAGGTTALPTGTGGERGAREYVVNVDNNVGRNVAIIHNLMSRSR